jgi:hypothetical protein
MAVNRYDQRKNLEEAEANAIGTQYLRADLLAEADRTIVRELLKRYVELRVRFYLAARPDVGRIDAETAKLQGELWSAVLPPARQQPNPITALVVSGMNDVINAQGYTQAAWWNRIPASASLLMAAIGLFCNLLVGYSLRSITPRSGLLTILPLFVATAFMISVAPQNLVSLLESLKAQ